MTSIIMRTIPTEKWIKKKLVSSDKCIKVFDYNKINV